MGRSSSSIIPRATGTWLAFLGVGVEAGITNCDLAFVRNVGGDPGDKLQVVHRLHLSGFFPILVADLACPFVALGERAFCPLGAEELLMDQEIKNLAGKEIRQSRVIDPGDLVEDPGLVHPALGHQEMEMRARF